MLYFDVKYVFLDFIILLVIISFIILSVLFLKTLLYQYEDYSGKCTIVTKPLDKRYLARIRPGDEIFDNLTKRKIASVKDSSYYLIDEGVIITISADTSHLPKGKSLSCSGVWFEYDSFRELNE